MCALILGHSLLPLDSPDDNQGLEGVTAGVVTCARRRNHDSQGDPAAEPEATGEQLDERNGDLM
jgi:hypothetical protein